MGFDKTMNETPIVNTDKFINKKLSDFSREINQLVESFLFVELRDSNHEDSPTFKSWLNSRHHYFDHLKTHEDNWRAVEVVGGKGRAILLHLKESPEKRSYGFTVEAVIKIDIAILRGKTTSWIIVVSMMSSWLPVNVAEDDSKDIHIVEGTSEFNLHSPVLAISPKTASNLLAVPSLMLPSKVGDSRVSLISTFMPEVAKAIEIDVKRSKTRKGSIDSTENKNKVKVFSAASLHSYNTPDRLGNSNESRKVQRSLGKLSPRYKLLALGIATTPIIAILYSLLWSTSLYPPPIQDTPILQKSDRLFKLAQAALLSGNRPEQEVDSLPPRLSSAMNDYLSTVLSSLDEIYLQHLREMSSDEFVGKEKVLVCVEFENEFCERKHASLETIYQLRRTDLARWLASTQPSSTSTLSIPTSVLFPSMAQFFNQSSLLYPLLCPIFFLFLLLSLYPLRNQLQNIFFSFHAVHSLDVLYKIHLLNNTSESLSSTYSNPVSLHTNYKKLCREQSSYYNYKERELERKSFKKRQYVSKVIIRSTECYGLAALFCACCGLICGLYFANFFVGKRIEGVLMEEKRLVEIRNLFSETISNLVEYEVYSRVDQSKAKELYLTLKDQISLIHSNLKNSDISKKTFGIVCGGLGCLWEKPQNALWTNYHSQLEWTLGKMIETSFQPSLWLWFSCVSLHVPVESSLKASVKEALDVQMTQAILYLYIIWSLAALALLGETISTLFTYLRYNRQIKTALVFIELLPYETLATNSTIKKLIKYFYSY